LNATGDHSPVLPRERANLNEFSNLTPFLFYTSASKIIMFADNYK